MSGKRTTGVLRVRLPLGLLARAEVAAERCGISLRAFVGETAHGALAERLCRHGAAPATPAEPAHEADPADGEDDE